MGVSIINHPGIGAPPFMIIYGNLMKSPHSMADMARNCSWILHQKWKVEESTPVVDFQLHRMCPYKCIDMRIYMYIVYS